MLVDKTTDELIIASPYAVADSRMTFASDGSYVKFPMDNQKICVGGAGDGCFWYDGTNMIINPKEIGTGYLKIQGDVLIDEDLTITGFLYGGSPIKVGDNFDMYQKNITNTTKITTIDLNVTGNFTGNQIYGEMWYHNHTATVTDFAVDGLYYNLTFDNSLVNGFIFNDAGDYLEAILGGVYKVSWMASGSGQNNHIYYTDITINGVVEDKCEGHKKMTAGGDIVTMNGGCLVTLSASDKIKLATADIGGTGAGDYYSSEVNLVRIGN